MSKKELTEEMIQWNKQIKNRHKKDLNEGDKKDSFCEAPFSVKMVID